MSAALLLTPCTAWAHEPENPDAHRSMPNQVTAGVTVMCPGQIRSEGQALRSVACVGASIAFARELSRHFDLRARVEYDKPFPDSDVLYASLHTLRFTVAPELVAYRFDQRFTVTLGPEVGGAFALTTEQNDAPSRTGWGFTVGAVAGLRGWVSYHTGFFGEVGAGLSDVATGEWSLRRVWLGRVTLGWADRF